MALDASAAVIFSQASVAISNVARSALISLFIVVGPWLGSLQVEHHALIMASVVDNRESLRHTLGAVMLMGTFSTVMIALIAFSS